MNWSIGISEKWPITLGLERWKMISGRNYLFFIPFHMLNKKYLRYTFVQIITIFPRTIHTNFQLVIVLSTDFSVFKN